MQRLTRSFTTIPTREYMYQIDLQGRLYLSDTKIRTPATAYREPKFLDFFFQRLQLRNPLDCHNPEFLYESRCGKELNLVRSEDAPIVFQYLVSGEKLSWAGSFTQKFFPDRVYYSKETGRLYHPLPESHERVLAPWQTGGGEGEKGLGLLRSALIQNHFADCLEHDSIVWKGVRYPLNECK
ncbi:UNVERIFIED_CONTAM: hypothetical protein HDU68_007776 [Siphonaria sp. JEL0065]|nr:hypothetical protein HDU68_007776 [Siphonaria sp. JEL0065]